jgi:hypothetical protein
VNRSAGLHGVYTILDGALAAVEEEGHPKLRFRWDEDSKALRIDYVSRLGESELRRKVWVQPGHGWRVLELRVEAKVFTGTTTVRYGTQVEGVWLPAESCVLDETGAGKMTCTSKVIRVGLTEQTPDDFRLAAFGFPEPREFAPEKQRQRKAWILAAAVGCFALVLGLICWRRRAAGSRPR